MRPIVARLRNLQGDLYISPWERTFGYYISCASGSFGVTPNALAAMSVNF
jgi:hypothetical protein